MENQDEGDIAGQNHRDDIDYVPPHGIYGNYFDDDELYDFGDENNLDPYDELQVSFYTEVVENCVFPSVQQTLVQIGPLFAICIIFRLLCYVSTKASTDRRKMMAHLASNLLGVLALYIFFNLKLVYSVMLCLLAYSLLVTMERFNREFCGVATVVITVVYLLTCEFFVVKASSWHQIRGTQMALAMRIISVGFDISSEPHQKLPNFLEFSGYCFCPAVVVFGPWISFQDYLASIVFKHRKLNRIWLQKSAISVLLCLLCVTSSNCIGSWMIPSSAGKWLTAYRDAQSFRLSHYMICYASEATLILSGIIGARFDEIKWDNCIVVSRPLSMEIPRSLVDVVTSWNLPMHFWLKTYVFKRARPLGIFPALIFTYAGSSLLHGFNFQLFAVLLSLGVYSFIEFKLRQKLAYLLSACIEAKSCKSCCSHQNKFNDIRVRSANLCFGALTMFHLAYLGVLFDMSESQEQGFSMNHTLEKWQDLGFSSHWIAAASFVFYKLI